MFIRAILVNALFTLVLCNVLLPKPTTNLTNIDDKNFLKEHRDPPSSTLQMNSANVENKKPLKEHRDLPSSKLKMDSTNVEDKNHLKQHLDPHVDLESLSIQEVRFRYFKTHDTDGNGRLDGTEIIQAIIHFHDEDGTIGPLDYSFEDDELELFVDPIIKKSDVNNDGFLDYTEFISLQVGK